MSYPARQLPMDLGQRIQHRSDTTRGVGLIVGWILIPSPCAFVRWQDGAMTLEADGDIMPMARASGAPPSVALAAQIRSRIRCGILPVMAPLKAVLISFGQWEPCDGCDELIAPRQFAFALKYPAPRPIARLHVACHRLWEAECVHRGHRWPAAESRPAADTTCVNCDQPIEARQNVVFRADGRVAHVTCVTPTDEPLTRLVPGAATEDRICPACAQPIRPVDDVVWKGACVVHLGCSPPRPIAGGAVLPAWLLIGDEHIGRCRGRTRGGHRMFLEACAETLVMSRDIAGKARRAVADTRAIRNSSRGVKRAS